MGNLLIFRNAIFNKKTPQPMCEGAWFAHSMHVEVSGEPWVLVLASHLA